MQNEPLSALKQLNLCVKLYKTTRQVEDLVVNASGKITRPVARVCTGQIIAANDSENRQEYLEWGSVLRLQHFQRAPLH